MVIGPTVGYWLSGRRHYTMSAGLLQFHLLYDLNLTFKTFLLWLYTQQQDSFCAAITVTAFPSPSPQWCLPFQAAPSSESVPETSHYFIHVHTNSAFCFVAECWGFLSHETVYSFFLPPLKKTLLYMWDGCRLVCSQLILLTGLGFFQVIVHIAFTIFSSWGGHKDLLYLLNKDCISEANFFLNVLM